MFNWRLTGVANNKAIVFFTFQLMRVTCLRECGVLTYEKGTGNKLKCNTSIIQIEK